MMENPKYPDYLGEHMWHAIPGYMIVGFELKRKVWEGMPTRSGWDNIKSVETIELYANIDDAIAHEARLREAGSKRLSYEIHPIQVKCPSANKHQGAVTTAESTPSGDCSRCDTIERADTATRLGPNEPGRLGEC